MSGRPTWRQVAGRLRSDVPLVLIDVRLVVGSFMLALAVRFDGDIASDYARRLVAYLPVIVAIYVGCNLTWRLYGQIWRHASVAEARRIVLAGLSGWRTRFPSVES
jgi:FlaA1/EpsC-like NDP-sugar epimerase